MDSRIDRVNAVIQEIKADCEKLKRNGELTERGKGQLDLVKLIEEILNK